MSDAKFRKFESNWQSELIGKALAAVKIDFLAMYATAQGLHASCDNNIFANAPDPFFAPAYLFCAPSHLGRLQQHPAQPICRCLRYHGNHACRTPYQDRHRPRRRHGAHDAAIHIVACRGAAPGAAQGGRDAAPGKPLACAQARGHGRAGRFLCPALTGRGQFQACRLKPPLGLNTPQPITRSLPSGRMYEVFSSTAPVTGLTTS